MKLLIIIGIIIFAIGVLIMRNTPHQMAGMLVCISPIIAWMCMQIYGLKKNG